MKEKIKKKRPKGIPRWQWREQSMEDGTNQPIEWYEEFFIEKIKEGLELKGEKLTKQDDKILRIYAIAPNAKDMTEAMTKMEKLFKESGIIDKQKWNDKMMEALKDAFDEEIREHKDPDEKRVRKDWEKSMGFSFGHPKINWNEAIEDLYKHSKRIALSGVVQNWYFKYGKGRVYRWRI